MKKKLLIFIIVLLLTGGLSAQTDLYLETIGVMGGTNLYLTFATIGLLADGYVGDVYDGDMTYAMVEEFIALGQVNRESLQELLVNGDLTLEDRIFVRDMISAFDDILAEADALNKFVLSGEYKYLSDYDTNRQSAWNKIARLMDLEE